jgi:hypothetical protein
VPPAYVGIRQHTSADVSIRQHLPNELLLKCHLFLRRGHISDNLRLVRVCPERDVAPAYVSTRQHTSAYVTHAANEMLDQCDNQISARLRLRACVTVTGDMSVCICQHTSANVSKRHACGKQDAGDMSVCAWRIVIKARQIL